MTDKAIKLITEVQHATDLHDEEIAPQLGMTQKTHAIQGESRVDLEFRRWPNGERFMRVKVFVMKHTYDLFRFSDIPVKGNTKEAMATKCDKTAAVLAEQLMLLYPTYTVGMDPSECAKLAKKHFLELCAVMEKQNSQEAAVA